MNDLFYLTDEQRMIRDLARKVARDRVAPHAARYDETEAYPEDSMRAISEAGLYAVWVPEAYGGTDMGALALAHVVDLQIDQRACCGLLEQQAYRTRSKEQQAWWIEETGRFRVEQTLVEGPRAVQVIGVLCDLNDLHWVSFARLNPVVGDSR